MERKSSAVAAGPGAACSWANNRHIQIYMMVRFFCGSQGHVRSLLPSPYHGYLEVKDDRRGGWGNHEEIGPVEAWRVVWCRDVIDSGLSVSYQISEQPARVTVTL
ncbi:hypothetical protein M747DRAFT_300768 [Aspergillus niger ATCC 13496]|uniref:Uncharacterized protein n=1 Tax=Aspergillus niger ATCC 13496 TaxID=1353008 RepID=A0A370CF16_ASPNG|nr:hypothetical protein M747DRAFT_300768 [Aspergillus niger ATCC 13496]